VPEVRFESVLKAFLCCLLIGGVAVGYVRQTHENSLLTGKISDLGKEIEAARYNNRKQREELSQLKSPRHLEEMARHLNLDLRPPAPGQTVEVLLRPVKEAIVARNEPPLEARGGGR
jgi:hypothetical protein